MDLPYSILKCFSSWMKKRNRYNVETEFWLLFCRKNWIKISSVYGYIIFISVRMLKRKGRVETQEGRRINCYYHKWHFHE